MKGIYKITSPTNKVYIGQSNNILVRKNKYKNNNLYRQPKISASINKYGFDNHKFEIIHELPKDIDQSILDNYEILYIELYRDCSIELMNLKDGGHNSKLSKEIRKKIGDSNRGKKLSDETKSKIGDSNRGKKLSDETKSKMSMSMTGVKKPPHTKEWKENHSKILTGFKQSEESIENNRKSKCLFIYEILDSDGNIIITDNLSKFCKEHNLSNINLYRTLKGYDSRGFKVNHVGGFRVISKKKKDK